jgi:hypothetical protein
MGRWVGGGRGVVGSWGRTTIPGPGPCNRRCSAFGSTEPISVAFRGLADFRPVGVLAYERMFWRLTQTTDPKSAVHRAFGLVRAFMLLEDELEPRDPAEELTPRPGCVPHRPASTRPREPHAPGNPADPQRGGCLVTAGDCGLAGSGGVFDADSVDWSPLGQGAARTHPHRTALRGRPVPRRRGGPPAAPQVCISPVARPRACPPAVAVRVPRHGV